MKDFNINSQSWKVSFPKEAELSDVIVVRGIKTLTTTTDGNKTVLLSDSGFKEVTEEFRALMDGFYKQGATCEVIGYLARSVTKDAEGNMIDAGYPSVRVKTSDFQKVVEPGYSFHAQMSTAGWMKKGIFCPANFKVQTFQLATQVSWNDQKPTAQKSVDYSASLDSTEPPFAK